MCMESDKLFDRRPSIVIFSMLVCVFYVPTMIFYPIYAIIHNIQISMYILTLLIGVLGIMLWIFVIYWFWTKETRRLENNEYYRLV